MKYGVIIVLLFFMFGCKNTEDKISENEFHKLMGNVAEGWSTQNTELALSSFDENAIYMEPPNIQYYRGHTQLRPYFDELDDNYKSLKAPLFEYQCHFRSFPCFWNTIGLSLIDSGDGDCIVIPIDVVAN